MPPVSGVTAFTTIVGSDASTSSPAAPFLTLSAALCAGVSGDQNGVAGLARPNCHQLLSPVIGTEATNYGNATVQVGGEHGGGGGGIGSGSGGGVIGGTLVGFDQWPPTLDAGVLYDEYTELGLLNAAAASGFNDSGSDFQTFYEKLFASPEMRMRDHLVRYVYPIIIILGNITNVLVLLIFRRQKLRSTSVAFYLSAYAIANLCVLDLILGITWVCIVFQHTYITLLADWTCRLWMFITNVITYTGIWLVVVVNIDRLIYIKSPVRAQSYCTVFSAKTIVTFVLIGLVVVSIHAMWTYELQPQGCFVSFQQDLHTKIWPWWSATVYSYIPLVLLLVLSLVQLITLCIRRLRQQSSPTNRAYGGGDNFVTAVLVISMSFFLLTVPTTAINLVDIHLPSDWLEVDVIARIELAQYITEMLSSLNNSILGCILFVCSEDFRAEFLALLRGLCCCGGDRTLKGLELRNVNSKSEDSSPHIQVDYELCNNNEENIVTNV